ncbi:S41 family peptidase [Mucilaginibacter sp. dw_454]|uniref:S41 family peptidase n=1 Tax=Mucilaginibacter sp. dw_454 TaxID=2720079 RepID=UPI001BD328D3|nr:S41 family peptidase [Mucilaginibacter sp. dw_454]
MKRALILIAVLCVYFCQAQDTAKSVFTKYYTVNQLKSDFVFFRATLETIHPSLYRYHSKDSVDTYFDKALVQLDHPMNELEYWRILVQIIAKLGSGHTSLYLSDAFRKHYFTTNHKLLPALFYIQSNRLFIRSNVRLQDSLLKQGSEVLAINNVSGPDILKRMRDFVSGDGYSNAFKDSKISLDFVNLYNLINGDQSQYFFVLNEKGKIKRTLVQANNAIRSTPYSNASNPPNIRYPLDMPGTAVITIPNFEYKKDYEHLHATFFKEIRERHITNLIIDLRNNPGGEVEIFDDLMGYVMNNGYQVALSDEGFVNPGRFEYLSKKSETNEVSIADIEGLGHSLRRDTYDIGAVKWTRMHEFKGKLYLLINGGSFSAAALFTTAVKSQRDCITVGEETGNSGYGSDAGPKPMTLPETHVKLYLPIVWYYAARTPGKNQGEGLTPDIEVPEPLYSIRYKGNDPVMEAVKASISSVGTKPDR